MWSVAKFIIMRPHDSEKGEITFLAADPTPRVSHPENRNVMIWLPIPGSIHLFHPYKSPSSLKQRNFKDISFSSTLLLHIPQPKIIRCTDSLSRNAALSAPSTVLPKPRLTNEKGHRRLWETSVSKCLWLSLIPCAGGLWAPTGTALPPCFQLNRQFTPRAFTPK